MKTPLLAAPWRTPPQDSRTESRGRGTRWTFDNVKAGQKMRSAMCKLGLGVEVSTRRTQQTQNYQDLRLTSGDVDTMLPVDNLPEVGEPHKRAKTDWMSQDGGGDK